MTDHDPQALLRRATVRLIASLLVVCAIPVALLLLLMTRMGYSWATSLMAAILVPLAMLVFAAYKLGPLLTKLKRPAQSLEGLSEPERRKRLDAMAEDMIASGRMTRAELDQIRSDAKARAEEDMNWLKAELDKASTDTERDRVMEEFSRRAGISS